MKYLLHHAGNLVWMKTCRPQCGNVTMLFVVAHILLFIRLVIYIRYVYLLYYCLIACDEMRDK